MNLKYDILAGLTFLSTTTQNLNGQNTAHEYNALSSHFCNLIDQNILIHSSDAASNAYKYAYKALKYSTSQNDSNNAYETIGRVTSLTYNPERQTPEMKQSMSDLSNARTESDSTKAYRELGITHAKKQEQINNKRNIIAKGCCTIATTSFGLVVIYLVGLAILRKNKNARKQIVSFLTTLTLKAKNPNIKKLIDDYSSILPKYISPTNPRYTDEQQKKPNINIKLNTTIAPFTLTR